MNTVADALIVTKGMTYEALCAFIYAEARLQDDHAYDEWEALWTDDATYWVPFGGDDTDPDCQISIIYDNRSRIGTRIRQLKSGTRYAQTPQSNLRRVVSNVEILGNTGDEYRLCANFLLAEWRAGTNRIWAGRTLYTVRQIEGRLRLAKKKVLLVNSMEEVPTLAFLI